MVAVNKEPIMAEQGSNHREKTDLPPLRPGRRSRIASPTPFAHLMRYHMERNGLSVRDMAELTGVSPAGIGHLLTGLIKPPIADQLEKIIQKLHLTQAEAELLELEALLGNAPDRLRAYVMELQKRPAK